MLSWLSTRVWSMLPPFSEKSRFSFSISVNLRDSSLSRPAFCFLSSSSLPAAALSSVTLSLASWRSESAFLSFPSRSSRLESASMICASCPLISSVVSCILCCVSVSCCSASRMASSLDLSSFPLSWISCANCCRRFSPRIWLKVFSLTALFSETREAISPCSTKTELRNRSSLMPRRSSTAELTPVTVRAISAPFFSSVASRPFMPDLPTDMVLVILYWSGPTLNSSDTWVSSLFLVTRSCTEPRFVSPKSANFIPSIRLLFPAPFLPVMRFTPRSKLTVLFSWERKFFSSSVCMITGHRPPAFP